MPSSYFDYNATTPVCTAASEAFAAAMQQFGNPSSRHALAAPARQLLEEARQAVSALIGAAPTSVFFTSGGTEANNWAIKGALFRQLRSDSKRHVIISAIEHASVLEVCRFLERTFGCQITCVAPASDGLVDAASIAASLQSDTALVALMLANNEMGAIQPITEVGQLLHNSDVHFHVDGVQAVGKIPVDVEELGADTLAFSGHKFHAPKGIGGLYIKPGIDIDPLIHGGGQEQGQRGGTEAVAMIAALGAAAREAMHNMDAHLQRTTELSEQLRRQLTSALPDIRFHGPSCPTQRIANTVSVCIPGVRADALAALLDHVHGIRVSLGSACSNNKSVALSHVLLAMGLSKAEIQSTLRLSIGRYTTSEDIDGLVSALATALATLGRIESSGGSRRVVAA